MKVFLVFFILFFLSCVTSKHATVIPNYFPDIKKKNEIIFHKKDVIQLGRVLFYDPILSANNTVSCSSCHSPFNAFAHTDHALSHGIYDSITNRNAPTIVNVLWQPTFMWDGAIQSLKSQPLAPIHDIREMGSSLDSVLQKLSRSEKYRKAFDKAFKDKAINTENFLTALAMFQETFVSCNAKYDSVISKKTTFTEQEQRGYFIFKANCNICHAEPLFTNFSFANNGLLLDSKLNDVGRYKVTSMVADSFKFKTPTLRNIQYTFPYMHDGRFKTLKEVLNFYISINKNHLADNSVKSIMLSNEDKADLIAFLLTLSDRKFIFNPSLSYIKE